MKNSTNSVNEEINAILNRGAQMTQDLSDLAGQLASLEKTTNELAERSRTFQSPNVNTIRVIDRNADASDPRETQAVIKRRLRQTDSDLRRVADLVQHNREIVARLIRN